MPKKILLADDSITIQKVVELTFSDGDYEVTAVNNGAKAVAKLSEMRPDIILSDIIMPEKNGYEVCEYVKSHPDFRNIPVVLLTGTFEPFDPDRAEKAGCDAVVTKPFESQSLIHKVEELISQAQAAAPAAAPEPPPAPAASSPWMEEPAAPAPNAFSTAGFPTLPQQDQFTHDNDIFAAPPPPQATTEMPFDTPAESPFGAPPAADAFSGETRAFPRMSFEEMQQMATPEPPPAAPEPPPAPEPEAFAAAPEPSPWDEPAATPSFEPPPAVSSAPQPDVESPFGAPPAADEFSGETRAFTKMSFEDMQQMAPPPAAPAPPAPEPPAASPWDEQEAPAFGGETRAFPKMSFEDMQQMASSTPPPAEAEAAPWSEPSAPAFGEEPPAFSGETSAFPKMDFGSLPETEQPAPPAPSPEASLWEAQQPEEPTWSHPSPESEAPSWSTPEAAPATPTWDLDSPVSQVPSWPAESSAPEQPGAWSTEPEPVEPPVESFSSAATPFSEPSSSPFNEPPVETSAQAVPEEMPFSAPARELEPVESLMTTEPSEPLFGEAAEESAPAAAAQAESEEPVVPPPALAPAAPPLPISRGADLTDEQIDRIARRVVELMSDQVVRNIAWEVIPDLAEMVVKERIRQLEAEA